jgi:hypothetical protein
MPGPSLPSLPLPLPPLPSLPSRAARRRALAALVALVLVPGCATTNTDVGVPVVGRTVTLVTGPAKEQVQGELLVVERDRLYVRAEDGVREVPLGSVREARVKRHDFGKSKAYAWSFIGGVVTGGALTAACGSVEDADGCGAYGLVTLGLWLGIGALSAPSFEKSSRVVLPRPTPEELRAFARLPQGLPKGLAPAMLSSATAAGTPGEGQKVPGEEK